MRIYFKINEFNRLMYWSSTRNDSNEIAMNVQDNHEALRNPFIFKYENGELIKDIEYQNQLIQEKEARGSAPTEMEQLQKIQADLTFDLMMKGVI